MTVDLMRNRVKFSLYVQAMHKADEMKKWLIFYSLATIVCYVFDGFNFALQFKWIATPTHTHTGLVLMLGAIFFFALDIYYLFWVLTLK